MDEVCKVINSLLANYMRPGDVVLKATRTNHPAFNISMQTSERVG